MRKRILSVLLTLAMLLTLLPVSAFAEEEPGLEETDPPEVVENEDEDLVEAELDPDEELYTGDELFALYVDDVFELGQFPNLFATGSERAYEKLKTENQKAAYTEILGKVDDLLNAEKPTATSTEFSISKALSSEAEMKAVYKALKTDHPEKFFWASLGYANSVNTSTKEVLGLIIYVAKEYSAADDYDTTTVDKSKVGAVDTAKTNAAEIVGKVPSSGTDLEKLKYLKDEICKLVEYNNAALNLDDKDYGNPWQLIWVFDNNENTNVVCEGYAKAFQYLCDQVWPGPNAAVQCYTVSGNMIGGTGQGAHMWNIVRIDSKSYLVDVTNCDGNSIGSPDWLFMAGGDEGNPTDGYTFYIPQRVTVDESGGLKGYRGDGEIKYTYGNDLPWDTTILTLAQDDLYKIPYIRYTGEIPETLTVGDEINLTAKLYNAEEGTYTFSSIDNKYEDIGLLPGLTINASTGAISGTLNAEKKLQNADNKKLRTFVEVKNASNEVIARGFLEFPEVQAAPEATSIKIYKGETETTTDSLTPGGTATYTAKVLDQNGNEMTDATVTWSVSDSTKAEVTDGVVKLTGSAVGDTVTVTAKVTDKETVTTSVTITVAAKPAYTLNNVPTDQTITYGDTFTPATAVTSTPAGAEITYKSSDKSIATVDANGKVTAVKASDTPITITVKAEEGNTYGPATATYQVTVTAKDLTKANIVVVGGPWTYTGSDIEPTVTIDGQAPANVGCTLAYENNQNAGNGTIKITSDGTKYTNPANPVTKTFAIGKAAVTDVTTTVDAVTIKASDTNNAEGKIKDAITLPKQADVTFGDNKTAKLNVDWSGPKETFTPKGGTYTFTGTVQGDTNLTCDKTITATVTVTAVKAALSLSPSTGTMKASEVNGDNWKPEITDVAVTYTPAEGATPTTLKITGWTPNPTIAEAVKQVNDTQKDVKVTLTPTYADLPAWATPTSNEKPTYELTLTAKTPVDVTVTMSDTPYTGAAPTNPTPVISGATITDPTFVYHYTGKALDGTAYDADTAPTKAGSYKVTATLDDTTYSGSAAAEFEITPATVTLTWSDVSNLVYDGTEKTVTATISGLLGQDTCELTYTGNKATNASKAGEHYTATAVLGNKNYTAANLTQDYTIAKADRNLRFKDNKDKATLSPKTGMSAPIEVTYADEDRSAAGKITFTLGGTNPGAVSLSKAAASATVTAVGNGLASIQVDIAETDNYKAAAPFTFNVTSIAKPATAAAAAGAAGSDKLTAVLDGTTIKVAGIAKSKDGIQVTLTLADVGLTLTQNPAASTAVTDGGKIAVQEDTTVYGEYTVDLSGVVVNDTDATIQESKPTVTAPDTAPTEVKEIVDVLKPEVTGVVGAAPDELKKAATDATGTTVVVDATLKIEVTGASKESEKHTVKLAVTPVYTVTVDGVKSEEKPLTNLNGSPVTVTVTLPSWFATDHLFARHLKNGKLVEILPVTVVSGQTVSWKQTSFSDVEIVSDARTVTVTFVKKDGTSETVTYTPADVEKTDLPNSGGKNDSWTIDGKDYTKLTDELLTKLAGKGATTTVNTPTAEPETPVTPPHRPSTGGSSSSGSSSTGRYNVSKASGIKNGSVSLSTTNAKKGDTVTITPKPNKGYEVDTITVLDKNGDEIRVREEDGKYTFTMPDGKVTVEATFRKIEDAEPEEKGFVDVPDGAYYAGAVDWAVELGITNGTSETTFSPNAPCTRAQIVTFLWRAAGSPAASGANPFTDVRSGAYYYDAVLWAVEQGITGGTTATTFSPDRACTRAQTVTFLYRYEKSPAAEGSNPFTDVAADAYYYNAVLWAVEKGVTGGTTAATFSPNATCTRGQIVTFLYRDMA